MTQRDGRANWKQLVGIANVTTKSSDKDHGDKKKKKKKEEVVVKKRRERDDDDHAEEVNVDGGATKKIHRGDGGDGDDGEKMVASSSMIGGRRIVALDCEMVSAGPISMLCKVVVIDYHGNILIDTWVAPEARVTDYRTQVRR